MVFLTQLYRNTALTSALLFGLLAVGGAYYALRNRPLTPNYGLALLLSEVALMLLLLLQIGCWLMGALRSRPLLSLLYTLLALAALPSVWVYMQQQSPRRIAGVVALTCVFVSGLVLRALQTGITR